MSNDRTQLVQSGRHHWIERQLADWKREIEALAANAAPEHDDALRDVRRQFDAVLLGARELTALGNLASASLEHQAQENPPPLPNDTTTERLDLDQQAQARAEIEALARNAGAAGVQVDPGYELAWDSLSEAIRRLRDRAA